MDSSLELETTRDKFILDGILHAVDERGDLVILHSNVVTRTSDVVNGHARDAYIRFEEERHKYFLRSGVQELEFPVSVSGVWSQYFDEFDAVGILDRYFDGWATNPLSKYWERIQELRDHGVPDGLIKDSIQQTWTLPAGWARECIERSNAHCGGAFSRAAFQRWLSFSVSSKNGWSHGDGQCIAWSGVYTTSVSWSLGRLMRSLKMSQGLFTCWIGSA